MEVLNFADARHAKRPLRAQIGRLIEVVGTPRFEAELFQAARSAINCEHMSVLAASRDQPPRVLLAANTGKQPIARPLAEKYIAQFWRLDPCTRATPFEDRNARVAVRMFPDQDIDDKSYRHECFTAVDITERFTLMQCCGTEVLRLNFLTGGRHARFGEADVDNIMETADLLLALVKKHDAAGPAAGDSTSAAMFQSRLRLIAPAMPDREMQVCTAIMLGMTSEAIALKLGISVNTVLTYRKRAYGRLNISCQNELMRLILF
jgi:DNA-binding CsgD family transcriptional regulator